MTHRDLEDILLRMQGVASAASQAQQFEPIYNQLQSKNENDQMQGLSALNDILCMGSEQEVGGISPDKFIPVIMNCFQKTHNPPLMLIAARVLTYLIDANPRALIPLAKDSKYIPMLLCSLQLIMDVGMEFAEQVLNCVAIIAKDSAPLLLLNNGMSAIICYIDFFELSVQKKIMGIVANLAKKYSGPQNFSTVKSALPVIHERLCHDDLKMSEEALTALSYLIHNSKSDPDMVTTIFGNSAQSLLELVDKRPSEKVFSLALQLLNTSATYSPEVAQQIIQYGVVGTFIGLLEPDGGTDQSESDITPVNNSQAHTPVSPDREHSGDDTVSNAVSPNPVTDSPGSKHRGPVSKGLSISLTRDLVQCFAGFLPEVNTEDTFSGYFAAVDKIVAAEERIPASLFTARGTSVSLPKTTFSSPGKKGKPPPSHANEANEDDDGTEASGGDNDLDAFDEFFDGVMRDIDDDDNYEDIISDENDDEDDDEDTRSYFDSMVESGSIRVENNIERHKKCRLGSHSCDICGEMILNPKMWLRCNDRPDFDICMKCIVSGDESAKQQKDHVFTRMDSVYSDNERSRALVPAVAKGVTGHLARVIQVARSGESSSMQVAREVIDRAASDDKAVTITQQPQNQRDQKIGIIIDSPHVLERLADALPCVCRLALDTDDEVIRKSSLDFIVRMLHYATPQLLKVGLKDAPLCEVITSLLVAPSYSTQSRCLFAAKVMMTKLPETYTNLFIREGVTNGLALVRSAVSIDARNATKNIPIKEIIKTVEGWKSILAMEAMNILEHFSSIADSGHLYAVEALCDKLNGKDIPRGDESCESGNIQTPIVFDTETTLKLLSEAAKTIVGLSTFELMHAQVIHSLVRLISAHKENSCEVVAHFVSEISACDNSEIGGTSTCGQGYIDPVTGTITTPNNLLKLVRQLGSIISQTQSFKKPTVKSKEDESILIYLTPHDPVKYRKEQEAYLADQMKKAQLKRNISSRKPPTTAEGKVKKIAPEAPGRKSTEGKIQLMKNKQQQSEEGKKAEGEGTVNGIPLWLDEEKRRIDLLESCPVPKTKGPEEVATIDLQIQMFNVTDHIQNTALNKDHQGSSKKGRRLSEGEGGDDDDDEGSNRDGNAHSSDREDNKVLEIDPKKNDHSTMATGSGNHPGGTSPSKTGEDNGSGGQGSASPIKPPPPVYLRYKQWALSPELTMKQVLETIIKKDRCWKPKPTNPHNHTIFGSSDLFAAISLFTDKTEKIKITYSTVPFTSPTVVNPEVHQRLVDPAAEANKLIKANNFRKGQYIVKLNTDVINTSGAIALKQAISHCTSSVIVKEVTGPHNKTNTAPKTAPPVKKLEMAPAMVDAIHLLSILYAACMNWKSILTQIEIVRGEKLKGTEYITPVISDSDFHNIKLSSKAIEHAANFDLIGSHDSQWFRLLAHDYPFIFTPKARKFLFEVTYFGKSRTLLRLQEHASETGAGRYNGGFGGRRGETTAHLRIHRQKLRVRRDMPLECAMQILTEKKSNLGCVFEFEFFNEPGSGLGPTMEFFTLVGTALQQTDIGIWRNDDYSLDADNDADDDNDNGSGHNNNNPHGSNNKKLVQCINGLFPRPIADIPFLIPAPSSNAKDTGSMPIQSTPSITGDLKGTNQPPSSTPVYLPVQIDEKTASTIEYFKFIGRFIARVMLDRRIPNMRFSRPLLKMFRGEEMGIDDIADIAPEVYNVLLAIAIAVSKAKKEKAASGGGCGNVQNKVLLDSLPKPCTVEDLGLTFVCPGEGNIPLSVGGENRDVTSENMEEYVKDVMVKLLRDTVEVPIRSLREGFEFVLSSSALSLITVDELATILKGHEEPVTIAELEAYVKCDHGFVASSPTVRMFFEILAEMTVKEQQKFFQFLTGSPALPVGGLANLRPKFTIVRKTSSNDVPEESQLPSAMTCQNYLKLPRYQTKEQMKTKLEIAINDGGSAFLFT